MPDWLINFILISSTIVCILLIIVCMIYLIATQPIDKNTNIDKNKENIKKRYDGLYLDDFLKLCHGSLVEYFQYLKSACYGGVQYFEDVFRRFHRFQYLYFNGADCNYDIKEINKAITKYNKIHHTHYNHVKAEYIKTYILKRYVKEQLLKDNGFEYVGNFNRGNLWKYYIIPELRDKGPYIAINLDTDRIFELFNGEGIELKYFLQNLIDEGYVIEDIKIISQ